MIASTVGRDKIAELLANTASASREIATLWLYGSRARGDHHADSDYDLAVRFFRRLPDPLDNRLRAELIAQEWRQLIPAELSLIDIDTASTPLAAIVSEEGRVLIDKTPDQTAWLLQKIWSKWDDWQYQRQMATRELTAADDSEPIMSSVYTKALLEHTGEHFEALDELAGLMQVRPLTFIERNSAQRSLQVIIEACIGLAKHVCKKAGRQVLGDALGCCIKAQELLAATPAGLPMDPADLRGAIGMRNAIVHDYLNLDWQLLAAVIERKKYHNLQGFIQAAVGFLNQSP